MTDMKKELVSRFSRICGCGAKTLYNMCSPAPYTLVLYINSFIYKKEGKWEIREALINTRETHSRFFWRCFVELGIRDFQGLCGGTTAAGRQHPICGQTSAFPRDQGAYKNRKIGKLGRKGGMEMQLIEIAKDAMRKAKAAYFSNPSKQALAAWAASEDALDEIERIADTPIDEYRAYSLDEARTIEHSQEVSGKVPQCDPQWCPETVKTTTATRPITRGKESSLWR